MLHSSICSLLVKLRSCFLVVPDLVYNLFRAVNKSFVYHLRLPYVLLFVYDEENQNRTIIISWFSFRFVIMTILAVLC